ncbi:MAG: hypothetical protein ACKVRO_10695 [Micropepsaceae bacterium]
MFLDRVFGVTAAAAFVLGLVCQVGWLTDLVEPSRLHQWTFVFFALAMPAFLYFIIYVGKRDGFAYTIQGELNLAPVLGTLPGWARLVSYGLFAVAAVFLVASVVAVLWPDLLPAGRCVPGTGSPADCLIVNLAMATLTAAFGALSFVDAVYLLRTSSRK